MSDPTAVSAPGKAFLIGEYAVLEGGSAVVTAIDVRAVAFAARPDLGEHEIRPTPVVEATCAAVAAFLSERGLPAPGVVPVVDTAPFSLGERKLGLGSSAAVCAAVAGFQVASAGLDPADAAVRREILGLARGAHEQAQGGGSGADVATAVLGGTIRFQAGAPEPIATPAWLRVAFVDAGAPAVTSSFLRAVRAGATEYPGAHRAAMRRIADASEQFQRVVGEPAHVEDGRVRAPDGAFERLAAAVRLHNDGLRGLQETSKAPILPRSIETIIEEAERDGLVAKPSGAGGGDLVVIFAPAAAPLGRLAVHLLRRHGLATVFGLGLAAPGLRLEPRPPVCSRLGGFFRKGVADRRRSVSTLTGVPAAAFGAIDPGNFDLESADHMIENAIGVLGLPMGVATNFQVNGRDYLVPMAVEEASVVAAASNAAKMVRSGGGFEAHSDPDWMIAQVQLVGDGSPDGAVSAVTSIRDELLRIADDAHPRLVARGGGAREIEARVLQEDMVVVHVLVDCQDAMGANLVNTVAEAVAPRLEAATGWKACLRILSNLSDRRASHVSCRVPPEALAGKDWVGHDVVELVVSASRFAELDPYRAATHNKGIMNGVDAVVLATGNDWRAIEAGAHAFAARRGRYAPLAVWRKSDTGWLEGRMSLPTAVGVVGGATRSHPAARLAMEILGEPSAQTLGQIIAAVGLASNLAALRALATEGIQRGHMSLHARAVALAAGAIGSEIDVLAQKLIAVGEIKPQRADSLLRDMRAQSGYTPPAS
jgi:degradative hydroxymethylglutaryl-CoA reductase